jgi:Glutamate synthase central domain
LRLTVLCALCNMAVSRCAVRAVRAVQVTNPAIDPFREEVVTSLKCFVGPEKDITSFSEGHAQRLELEQPVLSVAEMDALKSITINGWKTKVGQVA